MKQLASTAGGICLLAIGGCLCLAPVSRAAVEIEILARTGDVLPGRPGLGSLTLREILSSDVASDGTVAFTAEVVDGDGFSRTGVWKRLPDGAVIRIVSTGDDVLDFGFSDVIADIDGGVSLADNGRAAFSASLAGAPPTPFALFVSALGTPAGTFVAGEELPASGSGSGAEFAFINSFATNAAGGVVVAGATRVPPNTTERGNVWISPGGMNLDIAFFPPPTGLEFRFEWSPIVRVASVNSDGSVDVIGRGALQSPAVPATAPELAWIVADSSNEPIAEIFGTEPTPGLPGNRVLDLTDLATNSSRISALAVETEDETTFERTQAVYIGQSGTGVPVSALFSVTTRGFFNSSGPPRFQTGDPAPGTGGLTFATFEQVEIAETGRIAFAARIFDPSEVGSAQEPLGLWVEHKGTLELALLQGRPLVINGSPTDAVRFFRPQSAAFDGAGHLVVPALLDDSGETSLLLRVRAPEQPAVINPARPIVRVNRGQRRTVRRSAIVIRGRVISDLPVARVQFRSRVQRGFRNAKGLETWRARTRLQIGRNAIRIRATDRDGNVSAISRVIVRSLPRR